MYAIRSYYAHQLVDERIVGRMPASLDFTQAAALPLTAITAWEALFSRLRLDPRVDAGKRLLIIGGAGGVGSIAIQLAKQLAGLEVIATASRETSVITSYSIHYTKLYESQYSTGTTTRLWI